MSVGKDRSGLFSPAVEEYAGRLKHYTRFERVELPARRTRDEEAETILGRLGPQDWLVALDERGKQLTSVELASFIALAQQQSKDLLFAIGGDEGHAPELVSRARLVLSLSKLTLPHRLARVVIAEQLYRAFTILKGEPYHK